MLWGGVLAGPLAWLLDLEASYVLTYWACSHGQPWVLYVTTAVALLIATGGALAAWRGKLTVARPLGEAPGRMTDRRAFLSDSGLALSILFGVIILATTVPKLVLPPCIP